MNTLPQRARAFAVRVIKVFKALPRDEVARIIGRQFLRSGTAPGAHCREAFRGRSDAELTSKTRAGTTGARRDDLLVRVAHRGGDHPAGSTAGANG
ncbi:MAG TPA: four helix bundle protein [Thermoanaerobaculia bacterium]|nr:four helix bundle protein [Thermoanaerobaculia bacterium]